MIHRILVPLDGSQVAESAIPHASALANAFDAEVCLLRILPPGRAGGLTHDSLESRLEMKEAEAYLEKRAGGLRVAGTPVTGAVGEGKAAAEIIRWAHEHQVDLIVASAWGQGGPTEFDLGGTASKLVASGATSIMLIRPTASRPPPGKPAEYRCVMVPVDGSRRADWALCLAASIGRAQHAELLMVHVVSVAGSPERLPSESAHEGLRRELEQAGRASAERYLDETKRRLATPDVTLRSRVVVASRVPDALLRIAKAEGVGLVVMSAHGASDDTLWPYGSVASSLLNYCDLPLLVLQDLPATARRRGPADEGRKLALRAANAAANVPANAAAG